MAGRSDSVTSAPGIRVARLLVSSSPGSFSRDSVHTVDNVDHI